MRRRGYNSHRSFCLYLSLILLALAVTDLRAQSFVPAGSMTRPRSGNSATLLQDGRVLIVGGDTTRGLPPSAEIYDPVSGTFVETGAPIQQRGDHSAVLLRDGRVLLVGGCQPCAAIAELYNPRTGTFTRTGDMSVAQRVKSAVLLKNGKVLVVGGATAELFDPAAETFLFLSSTGGWYIDTYRPSHRRCSPTVQCCWHGESTICGSGHSGERNSRARGVLGAPRAANDVSTGLSCISRRPTGSRRRHASLCGA